MARIEKNTVLALSLVVALLIVLAASRSSVTSRFDAEPLVDPNALASTSAVKHPVISIDANRTEIAISLPGEQVHSPVEIQGAGRSATVPLPLLGPRGSQAPDLRDSEEFGRRGVFLTPNFVQVFDDSGRLVSEGGWSDGKKDGFWQYYDEGGAIELSGEYRAGLTNGIWIQKDSDGRILSRVTTRNNKLHGECRYYFPRESVLADVTQSGMYENGVLVRRFD